MTKARSADVVPIVTAGHVAAAVRPWRFEPQRSSLVVIAKCTCTIAVDGPAEPLQMQPLPTGDGPRYASDFVPFKPRADVLLVGHARPPKRAGTASVQLVFGDSIHRQIAVVGDRVFDGDVPSAAAPFDAMELSSERAFGGPTHPDNPLGRGFGARQDQLPNLEDPAALIERRGDQPAPAIVGPISASVRWARAAVDGYDESWLNERWPYLPEGFDASVFNAAPPEQRIAFPSGSERFEIAGVRRETPVVRGRLPNVCMRAFAVGDRRSELDMRLDTVWFDVDAMQLALVWRGRVVVSEDRAPELERIFVCQDHLDGKLSDEDVDHAMRGAVIAAVGAGVVGAAEAPALDALDDERAEDFTAGHPPPAPTLRDDALDRELAEPDLRGVDLSGCDLRGRDLSGRDLRGASLIGATLDDANLEGADLSEAVLARASMKRARLAGAKLGAANLTDADLEHADLSDATLTDASLARVRADAVNLRGAELSRAGFAAARLNDADLEQARGTSADFSGAELSRARFVAAQLRDLFLLRAQAPRANFHRAVVPGLRADGAELSSANFDDARASSASYNDATLKSATFRGATLDEALFERANLDSSDLRGASLCRARLRYSKLVRARASGANLMEALLERADMRHMDLRDSNLHGADTWEARLTGASLDGAIVSNSKLA